MSMLANLAKTIFMGNRPLGGPTSEPLMTIQPQYRLYASFFLFALVSGAMMSRLPDLQQHLEVTQGELGLTLIGLSIGSLISLTFSAPLIGRLGARTTGLITTLGTAVCFAIVP